MFRTTNDRETTVCPSSIQPNGDVDIELSGSFGVKAISKYVKVIGNE